MKLEVIDSEVKFMSLLNKVRELHEEADPETVDYLTEFYEHQKNHLEALQVRDWNYSI